MRDPKDPFHARATKLTPERTSRLVQLLRDGNWREHACAAVGIDARTLRTWLARETEGEPFASFALAIREAEAAAETDAVSALRSLGSDDWRALAWWLERRFPGRWGESLKVQVEKHLDDARGELLAALERACAGHGEVGRAILIEVLNGLEQGAARGAAEPRRAEPLQQH